MIRILLSILFLLSFYSESFAQRVTSPPQRIRFGTTLPSTCTNGMLFQDTDATAGQQIYACESGSWVLQGDGGSGSVSDTAYAASWDGVTTTAPSKNAVYDKIETIASGGDNITVNTTAATNANFLDNLYIDWAIDTAATPDDVTAKFNYGETLAGNPALLTGECVLTIDGIICEGTTADAIEMKLAFPDPATTDKTITLPNATDTLVGKDTTDTLTNKTMAAASNVLDADTAVALAADPADCATSTHFAVGVIASGAATCEAIGDADIPDSATVTGWVLGTSSATQITSPTVIVDLLDASGAVDMDYGSADVTDHTFITDGTTDADFVVPLTSIGAGEIVTDALTTTQLAATLTFADADLLDFGTNISSATEGILIPAHATTCASATAEGQLCWEEDADNLWIGDGAAAKQMNAAGTDTNAVKEYWWPASASLPLEVGDSIPPISKDAGTNIDQLTVDLDDSTDECRTVSFKVPSDVTSGSTITFRAHWYSAAATSGDVILDFRHNGGVAEGTDPDQALTVEASAADTTQGTAGMITVTTWTETLANLGWAANEQVDGEFCRDANNASDTLVGDEKFTGFGVEIPRS